MSKELAAIPEGQSTMLTQAWYAYGLAHARQLQTERQAKAEEQKRLQLLQMQQEEALITSAASPKGLYVAVALQGAKISLFRKAPSLST